MLKEHRGLNLDKIIDKPSIVISTEVESFSDIDQGRIIYRVVKQPDMTYASK